MVSTSIVTQGGNHFLRQGPSSLAPFLPSLSRSAAMGAGLGLLRIGGFTWTAEPTSGACLPQSVTQTSPLLEERTGVRVVGRVNGSRDGCRGGGEPEDLMHTASGERCQAEGFGRVRRRRACSCGCFRGIVDTPSRCDVTRLQRTQEPGAAFVL